MSNYKGNGQGLAYSHQPENVKNDKQQQKKKPSTTIVQIAIAGPINGPVNVMLNQNCSTVAEHAAFVLEKNNQRQGYGPDPVEELAKQMAQLAKEKEELKKQVDGQVEKMAHLVGEQAKHNSQVEGLKDEKNTLKKCVEKQEIKLEKHQKLLEEEEKAKAKLTEPIVLIREYAHLIGVPVVTNLFKNYYKKKLMQVIGHNTITQSIYVQNNQFMNDKGIVQSIVDLLATAKNPANLIGQVTIETHGNSNFTWPIRKELNLKGKKSNVAIIFNEASAFPSTFAGKCLAEYELTNKGCRFQVFFYYWDESKFNKEIDKFVYRLLK